jgi:hypothetical protein
MAVGPSGENIGLKIDWLNFTFPLLMLGTFRTLVQTILGEFKDRDRGVHTYKSSAVSAAGGLIAWTEGRKEAFCSLNAQAWDRIALGQQLIFLRDLVEMFSAKFTRVDCAMDDYHRFASMDEIQAAAEADNFVGFRNTDSHRPRKRGVGRTGDSRTFGSNGKNGSGKYLIIYDKALESKGVIDSIRYEARFFKQYADLLVRNFVESDGEEEFRRKIGRAVGGVIDFRQRGAETHVERMPRLAWWQLIVDQIGYAKVTVPKIIPPLEQWCVYAEKAVFPSLALLRTVADSMGIDFYDFMHAQLDKSEEKINWKKQEARDLKVDFDRVFYRRSDEAA